MEPAFEPKALKLLEQVAAREWPIIVHPDAMHNPAKWAKLGDYLCLENMDKRKSLGQTAASWSEIFAILPNASFCFDIGHAWTSGPYHERSSSILHRFRNKIVQLHVSEVNTQSKHDRLSLESILAFQKVAHLVPTHGCSDNSRKQGRRV